MYVIPDRGRVRPVAAHRLHRVLAPQRTLTSNKRGILQHSLATISMAVRAERLIIAPSLRDRAVPRRQPSTIRGHRNVALAVTSTSSGTGVARSFTKRQRDVAAI